MDQNLTQDLSMFVSKTIRNVIFLKNYLGIEDDTYFQKSEKYFGVIGFIFEVIMSRL